MTDIEGGLGLPVPIPPAESIPDSVRAMTQIIEGFRRAAPMAALLQGDSTTTVDLGLIGPAWEGARTFRAPLLVYMVRVSRNAWLSDVDAIKASSPPPLQRPRITEALDNRLRILFEFAFRFLQPTQIAMISDLVTLSFPGAEITAAELPAEVANSASRSAHATHAKCSAVLLGASGYHLFQASKLLNLKP